MNFYDSNQTAHPCVLFLPVWSALTSLRILVVFSFKKNILLNKKGLPFIEVLSWDDRIRRYSRLRPANSFHGVFVRCRTHPCVLFLPVRSALTSLRILVVFNFKKNILLNKKRIAFYSNPFLGRQDSNLWNDGTKSRCLTP